MRIKALSILSVVAVAILSAGTCEGGKRRNSNDDLFAPLLKEMDGMLNPDLGSMADLFGSPKTNAGNSFQQVLTWNSDQTGMDGSEGQLSITVNEVGYDPKQDFSSFGIGQDLQKVQQQLDEVLNFDTTNLLNGINKLLAYHTQNPANAPSDGDCTAECLLGRQYMTKIRHIFETFGQTHGMGEFLQTMEQLFRNLQGTNPSLAATLHKVFLSEDSNMQKIVEDFVNGRPASAMENVLKAMVDLSGVVDMKTLNTLLGEVKSVTADSSFRQALEKIQLMVNTLSNDQDATEAFQEMLPLLQNLMNDKKSAESLTFLFDIFTKVVGDPGLLQVLQRFSSKPDVYGAFEIIQLLSANATRTDAVTITHKLESMLATLADNERFLRVIMRFRQTQGINNAFNLMVELFSDFVSSNPDVGQAMKVLNETISGLFTHWEILQTFVRLSTSSDVTQALQNVMQLLVGDTVLTPELSQAVMYTMEILHSVVSTSQFVEAISTLGMSSKAHLTFESAFHKFGNLNSTALKKLTAVNQLFSFFANNPSVLEIIQDVPSGPAAEHVFDITIKLLKSLNTTSQDVSSLLLAMGKMLEDLAGKKPLLEAFINFTKNPDSATAFAFIMQILGYGSPVHQSVAQVVFEVEQALTTFTNNPTFLLAMANLTNSPSLVSSVQTLVTWLSVVSSSESGIINMIQNASVVIYSDQHLQVALQNYSRNPELVGAIKIFKLLVESLNTTGPQIRQALSTFEIALQSLYDDRDSYTSLEVIVQNPSLLKVVTDIAEGASFQRVFHLLADQSEFQEALLMLTNDLRRDQAVGIFHDIIVAYPNSPYASATLRLAVRTFTSNLNYTEAVAVVQDTRQLALDIGSETDSSPSLEMLQAALVELLKVLNTTLAVLESSSTTAFPPSTPTPTAVMPVTVTPTHTAVTDNTLQTSYHPVASVTATQTAGTGITPTFTIPEKSTATASARSSIAIEATSTQAIGATASVGVSGSPPPATTRRTGGGGTESSSATKHGFSAITLVVIFFCKIAM